MVSARFRCRSTRWSISADGFRIQWITSKFRPALHAGAQRCRRHRGHVMSIAPFDPTPNPGTPAAAVHPRAYALGYTEGEFKRLAQQGALYRDLTEDVLRRAGIAPGARVLDIGCGVGDVSMLAAELVGSS